MKLRLLFILIHPLGEYANTSWYVNSGVISDVITTETTGSTTDVYNNTSGEQLVFKLAQNYPNPFNPVTTIEYALPQRQHVILKLYDIRGREIQTLVDHEQMPAAILSPWMLQLCRVVYISILSPLLVLGRWAR